ncbi:hypothetical protein HaLaN_02313 [Haematococcus lacustris]|uniref:Uncharacterized protein n=1 Tax=Haematococcus lacustris TaxID=44745 RepID=A0A699YWW8_HAELA|nr:hypothetical protein HaLaN_02313 [Haematococcus lacustris]
MLGPSGTALGPPTPVRVFFRAINNSNARQQIYAYFLYSSRMSMPRDVCPEAEHPEVEISKVRAKIVTVEAEILEVKAEIMKVKADPSSQLRPGLEKEKQILREELVELRKKENILLGTKPSGTSPVCNSCTAHASVMLAISTSHAYVTFDGDESFKEYLRNEQCGGLVLVKEGEPKLLVVNSFAQLVPGAIYTTPSGYKEAYSSVEYQRMCQDTHRQQHF